MATARKTTPKIKLPEFNEGDKVEIKITGYVFSVESGYENDGFEYIIDCPVTGNEHYWNSNDKNVTATLIEKAPIYDENDVIMDAEGCVFQRKDDEWVGVDRYACNKPTRPWVRMVREDAK